MPKKTCTICENNINTKNKEIKCVYCDYECCLNCAKKFISSNSISCMSCKKEWNDNFLLDILPTNFRKNNVDYRNKIKNELFAFQESMFQTTSVEIENDKAKRELLLRIKRYKDKINNLELQIIRIGDNQYGEIEKDKILIIKQCPSDKCNGYLNQKYKCSVCDLIVCVKCELIKNNEEHICNNIDIKTVELKKKECKNCPNCFRQTFKDGGCYQVWCPPPCNEGKGTAWDFNTGKQDKGTIHAPLYYKYMRDNGGINNNDNENLGCGGRLPDIHDIDNRITRKDISYIGEDFDDIYKIHRILNHIKWSLMIKYEVENETYQTNLDIRKSFLLKKINDDKERLEVLDEFKTVLWKRDNLTKKKQMIYQTLEMIYNVGVDIYNRIYNSIMISKNGSYLDLSIYLEELNNIREYYNKSMLIVKKKLDIKGLDIEYIDTKWGIGRYEKDIKEEV